MENRKKTRDKTVGCRFCKKMFVTVSNCNRHADFHCLKNPDRKSTYCEFCQKELRSPDAYRRHLNDIHSVTKLKRCKECHKSYKKSHNCGRVCPVDGCSQKFPKSKIYQYGKHICAHYESGAAMDHIKKEYEEETAAAAEENTDENNDEEVMALEDTVVEYDTVLIKKTGHLNGKESWELDKLVNNCGAVLYRGIYPFDKTSRVYVLEDAEEAARVAIG